MILDRIENLGRYGLPHGEAVISFLKMFAWTDGLPREIEIKGRDLFVRPSEILTRAPEEGKFETHQVYADVQVVVDGVERMQVSLSDALLSVTEYDKAGDYQFFKVDGAVTDIIVPAGFAAIFFPGEAHRPCCTVDGIPAHVRKLVFKVRMP